LSSFSQKKFLISGEAEEEPATTWWIPITYTTKNNTNFDDTAPKVWLRNIIEDDVELTLADDEWVILNIQETGMKLETNSMTVCVLSCTEPPFHLHYIKMDMNAMIIDATTPPSTFSFPYQHHHQYIYMPPTQISKVGTNCRQLVKTPESLYSNKSSILYSFC
jgi:hypothetical protein